MLYAFFRRFAPVIIALSDNAAFVALLATMPEISPKYIIGAHIVVAMAKVATLKNASYKNDIQFLKNVSFSEAECRDGSKALFITGKVYNHPSLKDGSIITTSEILDRDNVTEFYIDDRGVRYKLLEVIDINRLPDPNKKIGDIDTSDTILLQALKQLDKRS